MTRVLSFASSLLSAVFVILLALSMLAFGVPGLADEPLISPPAPESCYNPNDGPCSGGDEHCGPGTCCPCFCNDNEDVCCDCFNSCFGNGYCND